MADQADPTTPRIKLTGLHIAGYRSLRRVDWPEDGLGWNGQVPDTVLVGGLNGSGKTTLLELIFDVVKYVLLGVQTFRGTGLVPTAERVEIGLDIGGEEYWLGSTAEPPETTTKLLWFPRKNVFMPVAEESALRKMRADIDRQNNEAAAPRLLYFPTDRAVVFPETDFKGAGYRRKRSESTFYRYQPPKEWLRSIEAILYEARWLDLNAKEQGQSNPGHFAAFERVMQRFFAGSKQLHWDVEGVLHVKTKDGALHPLEALSSGEKQVLLFGAELVERWTPGSLVLIDEPELHLHEAWLAALWELICELQRERGGQVIVATQSNYLFGLGGHGTRVLLGGWRP